MKISEKIQEFILKEAVESFLRYVKVWTTSDEMSSTYPTTTNQLELGELLSNELKELGLEKIVHDKYGYVYARLPASKGYEETDEIGLLAHLDTSSAVSGKDVNPIIHENYQGGKISLPKVPDLYISPEDSPQLLEYKGLDIITSEGDTLLGADNKAGIAEIMAACAAWKEFPELVHGPITICFTPDEETGKGMQKVDKSKLPKLCYTFDGGEMGELEYECFDAWLVSATFKGLSVHTGHAKNILINAIHIASRFLSEIPEFQSPEHTEEREGFYHLMTLEGNTEKAVFRMLLRDFDEVGNQNRMEYLKKLKDVFESRYPDLQIELSFLHQYLNMLRFIEKEEKLINLAKKAIEKTGLEVKIHSIRGGTDGARLSEMGIPTPNLFAGGLMFHSRKEYIPTLALQKATEVILYLMDLWASN